MKALAYIRVSTKEQGQSGFGLEAQRVQIEEFAKIAGYKIQHTFSDVHSAAEEDSILKRDGLQAAIDIGARKGWPIIVADFSRLSRRTSDLEIIARRPRLEIISCDRGESATFAVLKGQVARAEHEQKMRRERTLAGMKKAREQGKQFGNRTNLPDAQRKGADANKEEARKRAQQLAPAVLEIREMGITARPGIAQALNDRGILSSRGKPWTPDSLRRVLVLVDEVINDQRQQETRETYKSNPFFGAF